MEIDVRKDSGDKPDVIRFGGTKWDLLHKYDDLYFTIGSKGMGEDHVHLLESDIPNIIKALKKYQELYGEN